MDLCAFFHNSRQRRAAIQDSHKYDHALEDVPQDWAEDFLTPPFRDSQIAEGRTAESVADAPDGGDSSAEYLSSYWIATAAALSTKDSFMPGQLPTLLQNHDGHVFGALPHKLPGLGDGTPRTAADGSDLAESSSTSTVHAIAPQGRGVHPPPGLQGFEDQYSPDSFWKVNVEEEINNGAFGGGHFEAFPSFMVAFPCDAVSQMPQTRYSLCSL